MVPFASLTVPFASVMVPFASVMVSFASVMVPFAPVTVPFASVTAPSGPLPPGYFSQRSAKSSHTFQSSPVMECFPGRM